MANFYIKSKHLQLAEPLMEKYFDFHSTMLIDEMRYCVENSGINYKKMIDGIYHIDFDESFREHKELRFVVSTPYNKMIHEKFSDYFSVSQSYSKEEEIITDDDIVYLCLTYISYIYHK